MSSAATGKMHPTLWIYLLLVGAPLVALPVMAGTFLANVVVLGASQPVAMHEAVDSLTGIFLLLYVPAAALALICASIAKWRSLKLALVVYALGMAPVVLGYTLAYWDQAISFAHQKWTAAALSVGFTWMLLFAWVTLFGGAAWMIAKFTSPKFRNRA